MALDDASALHASLMLMVVPAPPVMFLMTVWQSTMYCGQSRALSVSAPEPTSHAPHQHCGNSCVESSKPYDEMSCCWNAGKDRPRLIATGNELAATLMHAHAGVFAFAGALQNASFMLSHHVASKLWMSPHAASHCDARNGTPQPAHDEVGVPPMGAHAYPSALVYVPRHVAATNCFAACTSAWPMVGAPAQMRFTSQMSSPAAVTPSAHVGTADGPDPHPNTLGTLQYCAAYVMPNGVRVVSSWHALACDSKHSRTAPAGAVIVADGVMKPMGASICTPAAALPCICTPAELLAAASLRR